VFFRQGGYRDRFTPARAIQVDESVRKVVKDFLTGFLEVLRMKKCLIVLTVLGLCATGAFALEPPQQQTRALAYDYDFVEPGPPPGPPVFFSDACPATDIGTPDPAGVCGYLVADTCASTDDYDASDGPPCNYGNGQGGQDEIFQFTVNDSGLWQIDTFNCGPCNAGWDTSLMVRQETGGGCPGDFLVCDGDSGHPFCGDYSSALQTYLFTGETYYLILDGWWYGTCGTADVLFWLIEPLCVTDDDCDDGQFCNGEETCPPTGICEPGTYPCEPYQACDEDNDVCVDPDPCLSWLAGVGGNSFRPYCAALGFAIEGVWVLDDIDLERACTDDPAILEHYNFSMFARDFCGVAQGTPYFVDTALWTVAGGFECLPLAEIAGTQCGGLGGVVAPGGTPPDLIHCAPGTGALLPDNSGDFERCEVDFYMGYRGSGSGSGFWIAGGEQIIGGPGMDDDFGFSVFVEEDLPGVGTFGFGAFADPSVSDFAEAEVCTDNIGVCCDAIDACTEGVLESECAGDWTPCVFWDPPACEDPDGDGLYTICGDNCPNVDNPGQEDCDGGVTPEGDACETDMDYMDNDGDGTCNVDDACPNDANQDQVTQCPCGTGPFDAFNVPTDTDGDGTADCVDDCPLDDNTDDDSVCDCNGPDSWWAGFNQPADDDGDGVPNCNDQCPGVDDGVFAPDCQTAIPTISEWGLVILALLLLVAGKVYFGRRAATS
jgi:hypothetical protein